MFGIVTNTKPHYFADPPAVGPVNCDRKNGVQQCRHILEIELVNGAVYRYLGVQVIVYRALMSAESKARFYDSNIKETLSVCFGSAAQEQKIAKTIIRSTQSYGATAYN